MRGTSEARWRELLMAARDVCQADCRRHRERATLRLRKATEGLNALSPDPQKVLLLKLLAYAQEFGEDPEAAMLVDEARAQGILPLGRAPKG